jgi:hypothetical protein
MPPATMRNVKQILQLEAQCEKAEATLHAEAKTIRNLEIQSRKK